MKRSDIIRSIQVQFKNLRQKDAALILDAVVRGLTDEIKSGNRIELRGFGVFMPRVRAAKAAYNPRTGKIMKLTAGRTILFRPSPELTKRMNEE